MTVGQNVAASQSNRRRFALAAIALIATPATAYLVSASIASLEQGYSWDEMDWAEKGHTTLSDFLRASDIGRRPIVKDAKQCVEFFSYKDAMPVKVVCK